MCAPSLKCFLFNETNSLNESSIYSNYYTKSDIDSTTDTQLNEIKIKFKNKFKLLTGIDEKATFGDLKLAILLTIESNLNKSRKYLIKKAKNYAICQSINNVEKIIPSSQNVQSELKQLNREMMFLQDEFKIFYIMRMKKSLHVLTPNNGASTKSKYILPEFIPDNYSFMLNMNTCDDKNSNRQKNGSPQSSLIKISNTLDTAIENLDVYIQERKTYVKLLEDYLNLLDTIEKDAQILDQNQILITKVDNTDVESVDTGFNSASSSARSSISSINSDNNNINTTSYNKTYVQNINKYISRYETYV